MSSPARPSLSGKHIVLGVTGSIAAYKAALLVRLLKEEGAEVQVLMTPDAGRFISPLTLGTLSGRSVYTEIFPEDADATHEWTKHVELGLWADAFVIAPATAQTIAKLANGFCDSMLTATALSARCPMLVCPAMDRDMYRHPATQQNLDTLLQHGTQVMPAETGELASGLTGQGRLPEPVDIVERIRKLISESEGGEEDGGGFGKEPGVEAAPSTRNILHGKKVLVTAGPTRERIDPARHLSNPSTGRMGFALARAAARRGAEVILVAGPTHLEAPASIQRIDVTTANEMKKACEEHADADFICMAAAVSDYTPAETSLRKMKKEDGDLTLTLERTPDIIAGLGKNKREGQRILGFALETDDGVQNARLKLREKNLDLIALNAPIRGVSGFGSETNQVTLISKNGDVEEIPLQSKMAVAERLLDRLSGGGNEVESAG